MPWRVGTMSEIRLNLVHEVVHLKRTVAESCGKYGISRKTGPGSRSVCGTHMGYSLEGPPRPSPRSAAGNL